MCPAWISLEYLVAVADEWSLVSIEEIGRKRVDSVMLSNTECSGLDCSPERGLDRSLEGRGPCARLGFGLIL